MALPLDGPAADGVLPASALDDEELPPHPVVAMHTSSEPSMRRVVMVSPFQN